MWSVAQDEQLGRHLVSTAHIGAGQTVLSQDPYASVLYEEVAAELCDWTLAKSDTQRLRCSACKLVRCDVRCHCDREACTLPNSWYKSTCL